MHARTQPPGLEDQLLGKLILKEKHELEEQRQSLLEEVQSYKKKIKQLEDDLLFRSAPSCCVLGGSWGLGCERTHRPACPSPDLHTPAHAG